MNYTEVNGTLCKHFMSLFAACTFKLIIPIVPDRVSREGKSVSSVRPPLRPFSTLFFKQTGLWTWIFVCVWAVTLGI